MVPLVLSSPSSLLATHRMVGCSTGYMTENRGNWDALAEEAARTAPAAAELSALSEDELPGLLEYLSRGPRMPFPFVSVHGPSKGRSLPENELVALLAQLPIWISGIVLHPDVMEDLEAYRPLGRRLVIENMDARKDGGQTPGDLGRYFEALPLARLCFDIAHADEVDPTLTVGREILDRFADRLSHVHVSSLDGSSHHVPLTEDDEERFGPLLRRCADVPWILEAPPR
jgi:hypothetical protein